MTRLSWGMSLAVLLALGCGDDTMDTDAGLDAASEGDAGPPSVCGNGDVEAGEACDDGNTRGGDGCSADCTSDETCGNGVVELAEVCDDGNTTNGDGCSAGCDSDETCGNGVVDFGLGEFCDDGNTADGDGCSGDCISTEICGNGIVDVGEECDDGNTISGDGCDASCSSEMCTIDSDCDDGSPCNGTETCDPATSLCTAGTPIAEGGSCNSTAPMREICIADVCIVSVCGDRFTDPGATPPEQCDDGDTDPGDGCDATCQLESCSVDADCDDRNPCTAGHSCTAGFCVLGVALSDGTLCDVDADPSTRDLCLTGVCAPSACGDGYVDTGEECDDGNTISGDGCEADCTIPIVPITAFRMEQIELIDPHIYAELGPSCNDLTPTVNTLLRDAVDGYMLNALGLFRPLDLTVRTNPVEIMFGADCAPGSPLDVCMPLAGVTSVGTTATNTLPAAMTCLMGDTAVLNPSYTGVVNTATGPCFVTAEQTFIINLGGVPVRLSSARLSATYVGGASPRRLRNGIIVGFLSEADARATTFDAAIPIVGGDTIYSHLADGGAADSACTGDPSFTTDDSDSLAGANGFWFYLNFEATLVDWAP